MPLWIDIKSNKPGRTHTWVPRRIITQSATGTVRLMSPDGQHQEVIDLGDYEWRWRSAPQNERTDEALKEELSVGVSVTPRLVCLVGKQVRPPAR